MAEKKGTGRSKAKSAPKATVKKNIPESRGGNNGPFYVLVIIILITVIVLLLNKFYEGGRLTLPDIIKTSQKSDKAKEVKVDKKGSDNESQKSDQSAVSRDDKSTKTEKPDTATDTVTTEREVSLYFLKLDEKSEKVYIATVKRKITEKDLLMNTFDQLIKGPTKYEQGRGYISAVPSNLKVRGIEMKGRTAEIDFNGVIEEGAAGDILMKRIQQIVHTATQFENVESVQIKINGQKRKTIGGDGLSIGAPLRR